MSDHRIAVVLGCGYLGQPLARKLLARYEGVWITKRSTTRAFEPDLESQCRILMFDTNAAARSWPMLSNASVDLFCLLPPPALETAAARAMLIELARQLPVHRAVITSSTAVYGVSGSAEISAESAIVPDSQRAHLLATIERDWCIDPRYRVLRLAGLYGPDRIIGAQALREQAVLPGSPAEYLNLIHVDDAADLLLACIDTPASAAVELGSDGHPVRRGQYYTYLASCLKAPPPIFDGSPRKHGGDRRCNPSSTMARLSWAPVYTSYQFGINATLHATSK